MLQNNPPTAGSFRYKVGHTVMVTGIGRDTRKTDIQAAFGDFGQILRIDLENESSRAFLEFEDRRDMEDAIADMDGQKLKGRQIRVEKSGTKQVSSNTPLHGAKGVHTVDRQGQTTITKEPSQYERDKGRPSPRRSRRRSPSDRSPRRSRSRSRRRR
mmetsp:Transcript_69124/g.129004  ORF Transcript_69124/g.129004 Transcript_69124/m.129004 type:complete len:157 (-) Transcript_69124:47-517(-)